MQIPKWAVSRTGSFCITLAVIVANALVYWKTDNPLNILIVGYLIGMLVTTLQANKLLDEIVKMHMETMSSIIDTLKGEEK